MSDHIPEAVYEAAIQAFWNGHGMTDDGIMDAVRAALACDRRLRGEAPAFRQWVGERGPIVKAKEKAEAIIAECMREMPVGNFTTHTADKLAARIADLAKRYAEASSEVEKAEAQWAEANANHGATMERCIKAEAQLAERDEEITRLITGSESVAITCHKLTADLAAARAENAALAEAETENRKAFNAQLAAARATIAGQGEALRTLAEEHEHQSICFLDGADRDNSRYHSGLAKIARKALGEKAGDGRERPRCIDDGAEPPTATAGSAGETGPTAAPTPQSAAFGAALENMETFYPEVLDRTTRCAIASGIAAAIVAAKGKGV